MNNIKQQIIDYLDYCEKVRRMLPTTMSNKYNVLNRFMLVTKIGDIKNLTNKDFNVWVAFLTERGVTPCSINTYNAVVIAMVRYYQKIGLNIPLRLYLINKLREGTVRRRFYTATEIKTAISYANLETELMIRIMFETGIRIAELTHLRFSDFTGRQIQFIGKGHKPREVYIRKETQHRLHVFLQKQNITSGCLFATLNGEPPTIATIRKRLKKPFLQAGLDGFYPHTLRHSFATNLQMKGASVEEIKEMMGHESIATTERYLHGFEGRLKELFDKYI